MKKLLLLLFLLATTSSSYGQFDPLVFSFDTIEPIFIDTNLAGNVWQIGRPQKFYFDSAYSSPNVIVTDTISSYPINITSEFIVKTPTYINTMGGVNMQFQHKYDTDSLVDGCTIYVSLDGVSWFNIRYSPWVSFPYNPFPSTDTITSLNDIGFSGKSDGWEQFSFYWNYPPSDTLWVKFKFASDNIQTNKEGWIIDDIIFNYDLGIGITESEKINDYKLSPNPFHESTIISLSKPVTNSIMQLFSSEGQLVKSIKNTNGVTINLHRNNLQSGLYYFVLLENGKVNYRGNVLLE